MDIMLSFSLVHLELNIQKYSNIQGLEENKKNDAYALVLQHIIKTQTTSSIKLTQVRFAFNYVRVRIRRYMCSYNIIHKL